MIKSAKYIGLGQLTIDPEALDAMRTRGGNWAAYQNHDLSSVNAGHLTFLRFGEGCTFKEPPKNAPDGSYGLGWRYVFVGTVDVETGSIKATEES